MKYIVLFLAVIALVSAQCTYYTQQASCQTDCGCAWCSATSTCVPYDSATQTVCNSYACTFPTYTWSSCTSNYFWDSSATPTTTTFFLAWWIIVLIVIGSVVVLVTFICICVCCFCARSRGHHHHHQYVQVSSTPPLPVYQGYQAAPQPPVHAPPPAYQAPAPAPYYAPVNPSAPPAYQ